MSVNVTLTIERRAAVHRAASARLCTAARSIDSMPRPLTEERAAAAGRCLGLAYVHAESAARYEHLLASGWAAEVDATLAGEP